MLPQLNLSHNCTSLEFYFGTSISAIWKYIPTFEYSLPPRFPFTFTYTTEREREAETDLAGQLQLLDTILPSPGSDLSSACVLLQPRHVLTVL